MLDHQAGARDRELGVKWLPRLGLLVALATPLAAFTLLAAAPPSKAIKTCSRLYQKPPTGDAGPGKAPLLIGDSVVGFAMPKLQKVGYRINAQGCRTFPRGIKALEQEARERKLPKLIVFELGTAGNVKPSHIQKVLKIIGPDRRLGLVTPRVFLGGIDPDAADYHAAAAADPRVFTIDWAESAEPHPEWFHPDLVHPNKEGVGAFTAMLWLAAQ